ncbi:Glycine cleavage system P-protein, partial [mine drainage metagenome]
MIVQHPNFFGQLEDVDALVQAAHEQGAVYIAVCEPTSLSVLRPPGTYGADIAVGEGQSLGIAQSFGGPFLGFMAARKEFLRRLPGRIVGETVDQEGRRGYVLTFQTREQLHPPRAGHVEHLHQPGTDGARRHDLHVAAGPGWPAAGR